MRYQLLSILSVLQVLLLGALSLPGTSAPTPSTIEQFLTDPNLPLLDDSALAEIEIEDDPPSVPGEQDGHPTSISKRALSVKYTKYSITIDGRNQANWVPFVVQGTMLLTQGIPSPATRNGVNYYDVLISIGKPVTSPSAGSLRFTTNRALYKVFSGNNANSLLDFAYVTVTNNRATISVTVDPNVAAANQLSVFNARSGLLAAAWLVSGGGFKFTVYTSGALAGSINLKGRGFIEPGNGNTPYVGKITGHAVGKGTLYL